MKYCKRMLSIILALAMAMVLFVPALASGYTPPDTCTVVFASNDGIMMMSADDEGETSTEPTATVERTWKGYQLLELTSSLNCQGDHEDHEHTEDCFNFAYALNNKYSDILCQVANGSKGLAKGWNTETNVTSSNLIDFIARIKDEAKIRAFADEIYKKIKVVSTLITEDKSFEGNEPTDIQQGYWLFVDMTQLDKDEKNTAKSLVVLDTRGLESLTITSKAEWPEVIKKVAKESEKAEKDWVFTEDGSIGETVYFRLTGTLPKNLDSYDKYQYIFHDTLSKGLTYTEKSVTVFFYSDTSDTNKDGIEIEDGYTVEADSTKLDIMFNDVKKIQGISGGGTIVVMYAAQLNKDAVVYDNTNHGYNENKVYLEYSNDPYGNSTGKTPECEVKVYTYSFDLVKTDTTNTVLHTAKFELYDALTGGNKINLVKENNTHYRVATETESNAEGFASAVIEAGNVTIKGLGNGTYYLEETEAPIIPDSENANRYNKLSARQAFTINNESLSATTDSAGSETIWKSGGVHVINGTGPELPSTGGTGTALFYLIGGILAVGAAVLLVTKRRMGNDDE